MAQVFGSHGDLWPMSRNLAIEDRKVNQKVYFVESSSGWKHAPEWCTQGPLIATPERVALRRNVGDFGPGDVWRPNAGESTLTYRANRHIVYELH